MYTTPKLALATFIMALVGVVRGLWGSIKVALTLENGDDSAPLHLFSRSFSGLFQDNLKKIFWG